MKAELRMAKQLADLLDDFRPAEDLTTEEDDFLLIRSRVQSLAANGGECGALERRRPSGTAALPATSRRGRALKAAGLALVAVIAATLGLPRLAQIVLPLAAPAVTSTPAGIQPATLALAPDACGGTGEGGIDLGGGELESGDFTFSLRLACDPIYRRDSQERHSEIDGLKIVTRWTYNGDMRREYLTLFESLEPYEIARSTLSTREPIVQGLTIRAEKGLQVPGGVYPDWKAVDARLRYVLKVQLPDGRVAGAALVFTLRRETEGFRPVDVTVEALSDAERASLKGMAVSKAPFPLLEFNVVYPEVKALETLLVKRSAEIAGGGGWIHNVWRYTTDDPAGYESGWTDYNGEEWSLVDAQGNLVAKITKQTNATGDLIQQVIIQNGSARTLQGMQYSVSPEVYSPWSRSVEYIKLAVANGGAFTFEEQTVEGRPVLVYTAHSPFQSPMQINDIMAVEGVAVLSVDAETGATLYSDTYQVAADGSRSPTWRQTLASEERIEQPPDEVMALFEEPWPSLTSPEATLTASGPAPLTLAPNICESGRVKAFPVELTRWMDVQQRSLSGGLLDGGKLTDGDFTFELRLACDPLFQRDAAISNESSEIAGLGLWLRWEYNGAEVDGRLTNFAGLEPYVRERGSTEPITPGSSQFDLQGISLPAGVLPDWQAGNVRLRYVMKAQLPDGSLYGAALVFSLQREAQGFRPADVQLQPLSELERVTPTGALMSEPPFPLLSISQVYPDLGEIEALVTKRQKQLAAGAAWIHQVLRTHRSSGGLAAAPNAQDFTTENWLQLDYLGNVIASITSMTSDDGSLLQQVVMQDGRVNNYTTGQSEQVLPYVFRADWGLLDALVQAARSGRQVTRTEESIGGRTAWVFSFEEAFDPPVEFAGEEQRVARVTRRDALDVENGNFLYSETILTYEDGTQKLDSRQAVVTEELVDLPTDEALALFSRPDAVYVPAAPGGAPAAAGGDHSHSPLKLISVPGDDFDNPSFWYGDIYAGDSLLGRVDFGATPGGWCQRSASGNLLAFKRETILNTRAASATLNWFNLKDVGQVFVASSALQVYSMLSWSPVADKLAFTGCMSDGCGLYLLDGETNSLRLLAAMETTLWQPLWKPDGSQVAVAVPDAFKYYVVDVTSGEVVQQAFFDQVNWQAAADSPVAGWGVNFARAYAGDCFAEQR